MKWLREPLVHFLGLGAALFVLFALFGDSGTIRDNRIVVSASQVELLVAGFIRTWQRTPSPEELDGLIDEHVREEVYYREALALGLDRDDAIVRSRMRQKLEFFADDMLSGAEPSEEDLGAYLAQHEEAFRVTGRVTFEHLYFNRDRRGSAAVEDARRLRDRLAAGEEEADLEELGDRLPLPRRYRKAPNDKLAGRFGSIFVEQLAGLSIGEWAGPIESGFGLHLVRITERREGRAPTLEEVREAVEKEWRAAQRMEAQSAFHRELLGRYEVIVEDPVPAAEVAGE